MTFSGRANASKRGRPVAKKIFVQDGRWFKSIFVNTSTHGAISNDPNLSFKVVELQINRYGLIEFGIFLLNSAVQWSLVASASEKNVKLNPRNVSSIRIDINNAEISNKLFNFLNAV